MSQQLGLRLNVAELSSEPTGASVVVPCLIKAEELKLAAITR